MADTISLDDDNASLLAQKLRSIYATGRYTDLAPPVQTLRHLESNRALFLCDAEICDEDIILISSFLLDKLAVSCISSVDICKTSSTQVKFRRNVHSKDPRSSSLNVNSGKFFKDIVSFVASAKAVRRLSIKDVKISNEILKSLSAALISTKTPLNWLSIISCDINADKGFRLLTPAIGGLHHLSVLSLEQCNLTDESIPYISSIIKAHSSRMDSLYWNSALRVDTMSAASFEDYESSVLGRGLVGVSLYGNRLEGTNVSVLLKVLRDNYWLLGMNLAENSLWGEAIGLMMNDMLSNANKMRVLLLRNNPGLQPYTAKALYSFMQSNGAALAQQAQLLKNTSDNSDLYTSVDGRKRFQMLPPGERQLLEHWSKLQHLESLAWEPTPSSAISTGGRQSKQRYVSPALSRYNRKKQERGAPSVGGRRLDIDMARSLKREEALFERRAVSPSFADLRLSSTPLDGRTGMKEKSSRYLRVNYSSAELGRSRGLSTTSFLDPREPSALDIILNDSDVSGEVLATSRRDYEDHPPGLRRGGSLSARSFDGSRRGAEQLDSSGRSTRGAEKRRSQSPSNRSFNDHARPYYPNYYERILERREDPVHVAARKKGVVRERAQIPPQDRKAAYSNSYGRGRSGFQREEEEETRGSAPEPFNRKVSLEATMEGNTLRTSSHGGRQRKRTESDNTEGTEGKVEQRAEKSATYLEQCITSVLSASNHLEKVSEKLQGVVETLSDSVNLSMSMQHQQLLVSSDWRGQQVFDETYRNELRQARSSSSHPPSPLLGRGGGDSLEARRGGEGARGVPSYPLPPPFAGSQRGDDPSSERSFHEAHAPVVDSSDASLSELIKKRMQNKLRALLVPELNSS